MISLFGLQALRAAGADEPSSIMVDSKSDDKVILIIPQ